MRDVNRDAIVGLIRMVLFLPAMVFVPAWTLRYWQAWVCLLVFFASTLAITVYLMKVNPELLARRMKAGAAAEKEKSQKVLQAFAVIAFIAIFVISAIDHRLHWSKVPFFGELAGDILIAFGFGFVFWVFKVNSFTSGIIEVAENQSVITSGPYAIVRHPMYLGALIMLLGIPFSLGSLWGLLMIILMTLVIALRLLDEEKFLATNLAGYREYMNQVHFRLLPGVW
jgi:protein-S-isoprenylcysteine O-methyltransferase Ste14